MTSIDDPNVLADASQAASTKESPAEKIVEPAGLANGLTGTLLTWASALLFYLMIILLPLVGQAAQIVSHYTLNRLTFAMVVVLGLLTSGAAFISRQQRRKTIKAEFPMLQAGLLIVYVFILLCLVVGLLKV